ncbi:MAG: aldehyde oxidase [Confluentimicrobium sp.]|uniref:xanthine dehydrogenase family protein molybdopterin-binding subunit n=1 Tax=Actibacterium sp. TaxID=1872125 RepID=UPI000C3CA18B|nr:xanthine dehydrogenase family protein molybdopterin-binding subunit [Actibacterium sp.]MBC57184.1 aldehyde oxidase [Actibacterium sp.]|tara:strand:+ start:1758 stop:4142 length:2385 start_codon:yes stop_codon:yes gene_type:complete
MNFQVTAGVDMPADTDRAIIGRSVPRKEDDRLLRGGGLFADDVSLAHQLEMAVARCPFPHARILRVDTAAAEALPGVVQVLDGRRVAELSEPLTVLRPVPGAPSLPYYALARDRATHEGQPVVSVVAVTRAIAEDALELIEIEYEPIPHVTDMTATLEPGAPVLHPDVLESNLMASNVDRAGEPEAQRDAAHVVLADRFVANRVAPLPMETRGIVVSWRAGARALDVRSSTQVPHLVRKQLAESLRLDESSIRVVASDVGGAYGLKLGAFPEDILACLHAMLLERPVKWIEDRMEYFRASTHGREAFHDMMIAAEKDGRITSIMNEYTTDIGGWNSPFGSSQLSSVTFTGPYKVADAQVKRNVVLTNKTPVGAYRGYGQPEVNFAREVLLDRLARRLNKSPLEMRRLNMLRPEDLPWTTPSRAIYDNGDYLRTLEMAATAVDYERHWAASRKPRGDGRIVGIGLSSFVERTGYASARFLANRGSQFGAHESVTLRVNRSGGVDLYTGVSTFGQGSETAFAQICAQVLGIDYDVVRVHAGDTGASPLNTGAFASRTLIAAAGALKEAAEAIRDKVLVIAAMALEAETDALEIRDMAVCLKGDQGRSISFKDIFNRAITGQGIPEGIAPGLEATAHFEPRSASFSFGTAAAVVAVEPATGDFEIERFVMVHDCGVPVNPLLVEGQVRGALVQGLGAALDEELRYDPETGQLMNGSMMDYFAPMASDVPPIELLHTEVPSDVTPFGVRGVGEVGTIPPAAALTNAVCDALVDFGVEISQMPLTPERIWRAIRAGAAS